MNLHVGYVARKDILNKIVRKSGLSNDNKKRMLKKIEIKYLVLVEIIPWKFYKTMWMDHRIGPIFFQTSEKG